MQIQISVEYSIDKGNGDKVAKINFLLESKKGFIYLSDELVSHHEFMGDTLSPEWGRSLIIDGVAYRTEYVSLYANSWMQLHGFVESEINEKAREFNSIYQQIVADRGAIPETRNYQINLTNGDTPIVITC